MKTVLIIAFSFLLSSMAAAEPKQYGRYYISAQPSEKELKDFKKQKGAVVVDLRDFDELGNCSEPATVAKLDMKYGRAIFSKTEKISAETIQSIEEQVGTENDKPALIFCKTGSRSSAWLAIHLVEKENIKLEEAINIARTTGLKKEMESKVRDYFSSRATH